MTDNHVRLAICATLIALIQAACAVHHHAVCEAVLTDNIHVSGSGSLSCNVSPWLP